MVIAVIGLLVGGIMGGRSLIRASELRSVITDANNYITALNSFKSQYRGLPGDMTNAANYWASATSGNGDGLVCPAFGPQTECYQYWKQLSLSGFIEGDYTGASDGGTKVFTPGVNVPKARITKSGFSAYYLNFVPVGFAPWYMYTMNYGNMIAVGGAAPIGPTIQANLSPVDASVIDTKADDGMPGSGGWIANLTGGIGFSPLSSTLPCTNATGPTDYASTYNTQNSDAQLCSFLVLTGN